LKELETARFSATDLKEAKYDAGDLKGVGFSAAQLKEAQFSATQLRGAGFSLTKLKEATFSAVELAKAKFTYRELYDVGFQMVLPYLKEADVSEHVLLCIAQGDVERMRPKLLATIPLPGVEDENGKLSGQLQPGSWKATHWSFHSMEFLKDKMVYAAPLLFNPYGAVIGMGLYAAHQRAKGQRQAMTTEQTAEWNRNAIPLEAFDKADCSHIRDEFNASFEDTFGYQPTETLRTGKGIAVKFWDLQEGDNLLSFILKRKVPGSDGLKFGTIDFQEISWDQVKITQTSLLQKILESWEVRLKANGQEDYRAQFARALEQNVEQAAKAMKKVTQDVRFAGARDMLENFKRQGVAWNQDVATSSSQR